MMARVPAIFTLMILFAVNSLYALEAPPTADDVRDLMEHQPLTKDTWPNWRDYFVRLYYVTDADEPEDFYSRISDFVGDVAFQNGGTLSRELEEDPVAWIILSNYFSHQSPRDFKACERAAEKALAIGDPMGMSSYVLANFLIFCLPHIAQDSNKVLSAQSQQHLARAEALLQEVERASPPSKVEFPTRAYCRCSPGRGNGDFAAATGNS